MRSGKVGPERGLGAGPERGAGSREAGTPEVVSTRRRATVEGVLGTFRQSAAGGAETERLVSDVTTTVFGNARVGPHPIINK